MEVLNQSLSIGDFLAQENSILLPVSTDDEPTPRPGGGCHTSLTHMSTTTTQHFSRGWWQSLMQLKALLSFSSSRWLKHMAAHSASRAFAVDASVMEPGPEAKPAVEPVPALPAVPWIVSIPESLN